MTSQRSTPLIAVILAILCAWIGGCGQNPVSMVKTGHLESNKSTSIGDAIDHYRYFRGVQCRAATTANARRFPSHARRMLPGGTKGGGGTGNDQAADPPVSSRGTFLARETV